MPGDVQTALLLLLLGVNLYVGSTLAKQVLGGDTEEVNGAGAGQLMQFPQEGAVAVDMVRKSNKCADGVRKPISPSVVNKEISTDGYGLLANSPKTSLSESKNEFPPFSFVMSRMNGSAVPFFKVNSKNDPVASTDEGNRKSELLLDSHLVHQSIESFNPDSESSQKNEPNLPSNQNNEGVSSFIKVSIALTPQQQRTNGSMSSSSSLKQMNELVISQSSVNVNSKYIAPNQIPSEKNESIHDERQKNDSLVPYSIIGAPAREIEPDKICPSGMKWATGQCRKTLV